MISLHLVRNQHYVFQGRLAQLARALARQARGHWFESSIAHIINDLRQLSSLPCTQGVSRLYQTLQAVVKQVVINTFLMGSVTKL